MGYFNYFIKCIIRKFVNLLFKPKMFLTLLIIIGVLFAMQITSRAEWTDDNIQRVIEDLESIAGTNIYIFQELEDISTFNEWMSADLVILRNTLYEVNTKINSLTTSVTNIESELSSIVSQLQSVNTGISNIYNKLNENHKELIEKLDENQQQLLAELEADNQAVLEELNMIRDVISGTEEEQCNFLNFGKIYDSSTSERYCLRCISINYQPNYTYRIKVTYNMNESYSFTPYIGFSDNLIPADYTWNDYKDLFYRSSLVPIGNGTYIINIDVPSNKPKYIYMSFVNNIKSVEVYRSIKGIVESLNDSNSLQQQQNQLQQEQNDLLKDDNVNTDGLEFATDDTVNPTTDGFNTFFNTVYNAFCNTSSQPLTITLPFINKTFTIQPNIVSNAMQKAGLGVVVTLINSFYYYSVCLFIYKDIAKIVDNLKSGNITSDCGNVKTEVL